MKAYPLPLDLVLARREACNGSHKMRQEQCTSHVGGGGSVAQGMEWFT
jgi:hypothetical protein